MKNANYKKLGMSILVDLPNGYSVRATSYLADKNRYIATYELKTSHNGDYHETDDNKTFTFATTGKENVHEIIASHILTVFSKGYFDKYVKRVELELKAADIGFAHLEGVSFEK